MKKEEFIKMLVNEASIQAELEKKIIFPKQLGFLLNTIAKLPWQILLIASLLTSIIVNVW